MPPSEHLYIRASAGSAEAGVELAQQGGSRLCNSTEHSRWRRDCRDLSTNDFHDASPFRPKTGEGQTPWDWQNCAASSTCFHTTCGCVGESRTPRDSNSSIDKRGRPFTSESRIIRNRCSARRGAVLRLATEEHRIEKPCQECHQTESDTRYINRQSCSYCGGIVGEIEVPLPSSSSTGLQRL